MFISGQQRSQHLSYGLPVRQVGTQESPICEIVAPIVKYAAIVRSLAILRGTLATAYNFATMERPGPVWVDVPMDVLWSHESDS